MKRFSVGGGWYEDRRGAVGAKKMKEKYKAITHKRRRKLRELAEIDERLRKLVQEILRLEW